MLLEKHAMLATSPGCMIVILRYFTAQVLREALSKGEMWYGVFIGEGSVSGSLHLLLEMDDGHETNF